MKTEKMTNGNEIIIKVSGKLATTTAPALETAVMECVDTCESLILDFEALEYISSAGLRVILKAQKAMMKKGGIKLIHLNDTIMEIFEITGFADMLTIE